MAAPTESVSNSSDKRSETSKESQDKHVEDLVSGFTGQCKIIDGTGRFKKIIKLHPEGQNIVFNFKIPEGFPSTLPVIEVRSDTIDEDDAFDLKTFLAQTIKNDPDMAFKDLVQIGLDWLKEGNINLNDRKAKANQQPHKRNKKKEKKNRKEQVDKPKKPPMKTALDVIKRVQWDSDIDQDQCIVGYMDRLEGLKEKYFNAFSWEDIASVDYTVLAIPKHRIQYFKYRGEIVWDKRARLDNVFGSTGSKVTIKDVIRKQDGVDAVSNEADADEQNAQQNDRNHEDSDYYDSDDITDSDSDSDDGITVTIGNAGAHAMFDDGDYKEDDVENAENEGDNFDKYWRDKLRPNYFIALRITDEDIRNMVQGIQNHIVAHEPAFKECNIPANALHITLCTLGLDTPDKVQTAVQCLRNVQEELSSFLSEETKLKFSGVDHFFNRVVYGKVVDCPPEFYEFVEHLKMCLNTQGVEIRDYHEFVPHMTLMKISRPVANATGKRYVPPWLYSCFNNTEIGYQSVDNLHLCEMGDCRQDDGFYMTAMSLDL